MKRFSSSLAAIAVSAQIIWGDTRSGKKDATDFSRGRGVMRVAGDRGASIC